jgi:hypothetical protein
MANPNLKLGALLKPAKGTAWQDGRDRRKAVRDYEDEQKAIVRKRDRVCRWPHCEHCAKAKRDGYAMPLEVAHLVAKGMGGDHRTRSSADQMMLLCRPTHQYGPDSLEQHGRRIEPLTPAGTNGACAFYRVGPDGREYAVALEVGPSGPYERD